MRLPQATKPGAPFAFAGLWEGWCSPDGNIVRSFAILTTSANAMKDQWSIWLDEVEGSAPDLMQPAAPPGENPA